MKPALHAFPVCGLFFADCLVHLASKQDSKRPVLPAGRLLFWLWLLFLLPGQVRSHADLSPQMLSRAKKATALVEVRSGAGYGSAFCIDASGVFVTNQHVVESASNQTVTLILNSGEANEKTVVAHVLRADKESDLALLQASTPGAFAALPLGNSDGLAETMSVIALGYPFGTDLAARQGEYPNISVSLGHITALRKSRGALKSLQLDAALNHGNSGGPVLNVSGQVIGVVQSGIPGASINFAIPINALTMLRDATDLNLSPLTIPATHCHDAQTFLIRVVTLHRSRAGITVSMELDAGEGLRRFTAKAMDGATFTVKAVPVPSGAPAASEVRYHLVARQDGAMIGEQTGVVLIRGTAQAASKNALPKEIKEVSAEAFGTQFRSGILKLIAAADRGFASIKGAVESGEIKPTLQLPDSADAVLEEAGNLHLATYIYRFKSHDEAEQRRNQCVDALKDLLTRDWTQEERGSTMAFLRHNSDGQWSVKPLTVNILVSRPANENGNFFWLKITAAPMN